MQQQGNPNQQEANDPGRSGRAASEQNERLNINDPAGKDQQSGNDDYKRDGAHLGGTSSEGQNSDTTGSTQKGGGGSGYDPNREQQEVNKEQEEMHRERDPDHLNPERTQTPRPEPDPGRENPAQPPQQPETKPGTSTMGSLNRNVNGAWSQSSWDSGSLR